MPGDLWGVWGFLEISWNHLEMKNEKDKGQLLPLRILKEEHEICQANILT